MRKTLSALVLPAALLFALGLSACNSNEVPVSESTGSDETTTSAHDDSSQKPTEKPSVRVSERPSEKPSEKPTTGPKPTATASTKGRTIHSTELQVGDCYNKDTTGSQIGDVEVVDCSAPHQYEAYNNHDIPGSDFPEGEAMGREVRNACYDSFATYVGISYDNSTYRINSFNPTSGSWAQGDRTITCTIKSGDGSRITGSLKGAAK
mgnify:CR=1 FL=1